MSRRGAVGLAAATAGLALHPFDRWTAQARTLPAAEGAATVDIIYFVCCAGAAEIPLHNAFDQRFTKEHPGLRAKAEYLPAGVDYFAKLQTLIASNTVPTLFDMWEGYVQPYAAAGLLEDLTPFVQADPTLKLRDFYPSTLAVNSYQGRLYAMPFTGVANPILYYNADLLDKAHIKHPDTTWTWDTLRSAARALTVRKGSTTTQWGVGFDTWFVPWLEWIWSNGGDFFNADSTKCTANMPQNAQAIQFWADLINKDKVAPSASAVKAYGGMATAFQQGRLALYLGYTWDVAGFLKATTLNWWTALPPKAPSGKRVAYYNDGSIAMSVSSKNKQDAFEYLKAYAVDFEKQRSLTLGELPAYKPLQPFWATHANKRSVPEIQFELLPAARYPGGGVHWDKISTLAQAELDRVFNGTNTAAKALDIITPQANAELQRGGL
jgi:multiple sugar transport system substrate-binding protein